MLKHYLLIAIRNLKRHKASFFINWIGLSTGLACAFLIYLWVSDEQHFDKFHVNDKRLCQVMEKNLVNHEIQVHEGTQGLLAQAMQKDLPEVEAAVPLLNLKDVGVYLQMKNGNKLSKATGIFAGKDFFRVFSFHLLQGNPNQALANRQGIVLSEQQASSLFGSPEKAMGQTVSWQMFGHQYETIVTGVADRTPYNSSLDFDFVLTYDLMINQVWTRGQNWQNEGPVTYLLLKPGTDITAFNAKIGPFVKKYSPNTGYTLFTRPYSSAYLHGTYVNGVQSGGRIEYVRIFSVIAILILVIACINFMNLSTARASRRAKEVGIKKVMGSSRLALIGQFMGEAIFTSFLSLLLALLIAYMLLPVFNQVTGKHLGITFSPSLITALISITLLTGFFAGSYPAFYLSGFKPVSVLKGRLRNSFVELLTRQGLVVFQFAMSLTLIIAMIVIYRQVDFIQSVDLGYNRDHVIYFDKEGTLEKNQETFLTQLKQIPGVASASSMEQNIAQADIGSSTYGVNWAGKPQNEEINFGVRSFNYGLTETLGMHIKEGRTFSTAFGQDSSNIMVNETAVRTMGLKNPIGARVNLWGQDKTVIGVVKDFHVSSLHDPIMPMLYYCEPGHTSLIMARLAAGQEKETLSRIGDFYRHFNPGFVFEYKFLDETYQSLYVSEQRISLLSRYFAGLAILISCLGLSGLAAYNAESRTKEIGIRKVLGASVQNVTLLLSKVFVRLIVISMLIAFPLTGWLMYNWLSGFAYHISIGWETYAIGGGILLLITLLTVSYQSIRAALINPVQSMRTE